MNKKWKVRFHPKFIKDCRRLFSNNPIYAIPRFFSNVKREIRWGWQRLFRGFDDRFYWGLYCEISEIVPKVTKWMRKNGHGCPNELFDKNNKKDECWKWNEILLKIEKGFEALKKMDECPWNRKEYKKLEKIYNEGTKLFLKYFRSLWD